MEFREILESSKNPNCFSIKQLEISSVLNVEYELKNKKKGILGLYLRRVGIRRQGYINASQELVQICCCQLYWLLFNQPATN